MAKGREWKNYGHKGSGSITKSVFAQKSGSPTPLNHFSNKMQPPGPVIVKVPADPAKLAALQAFKQQYQLKKEPKDGRP